MAIFTCKSPAMKAILFLLMCSLAFCLPFNNKPAPDNQEKTIPNETSAANSVVEDTVSFSVQVMPILQSRCNPCHFPGGKMYDKMPFDRAETLTGHEKGVLKRVKNVQENELIKQYYAQKSPVNFK